MSGMHPEERALLVALAKHTADPSAESRLALARAVEDVQDTRRCMFDGNLDPCIQHCSADGYRDALLAACTRREATERRRQAEDRLGRHQAPTLAEMRCETCARWTRLKKDQVGGKAGIDGWCGLTWVISSESPINRITTPDFGCVQWKPAEKDRRRRG